MPANHGATPWGAVRFQAKVLGRWSFTPWPGPAPGPVHVKWTMGKSSNKKNQSGKHQKYKTPKKVACEPQHKISKSDKVKDRRKGQKVVEVMKKDLGVPNMRQLLRGVESQKAKVSKEKIQDILDRKRAQEKARTAAIPQSQQLAALKASAANRLASFDMHVDSVVASVPGGMAAASFPKPGDVEHTRRAFYRELHKILETADVILEVSAAIAKIDWPFQASR